MFKKLLLIGFVTSFWYTQAQAPSNYYNNTQGKSGYELKTELHQIITQNHIAQSYGDAWSFFEENDVTPEGDVWDIYSDCVFTFGVPEFGGNQDTGSGGNIECEFFNREHVFPRSWFGGASMLPEHSDIINLLPVDKLVNNVRGALVFAEISSPDFTSSNGSQRGNSSTTGYNGTAFEVLDEYKGDIARIFFYMATRYENVIGFWQGNNENGDVYLDGTSGQVYEDWVLDMLYEWHVNDPVDQKEIDRNNAAFEFQGNRNPFVDHPDFACAIWNVDEENCTLSTPAFDLKESISIYPNPVTHSKVNISTKVSVDVLEIYSITGKLVQKIKPNNNQVNFEVNHLKSGIYLLKVNSNQQSSTHKIIVK